MVFDDCDLNTLGSAYDRAWDRFLRTGMLTPENLCMSREVIAKRILHCAETGERDAWRLARDALFNLWQLQSGAPSPLPITHQVPTGNKGPTIEARPAALPPR